VRAAGKPGAAREASHCPPDANRRPCAIAVSYEAKAFGIKTGTGVGEARRLCPGVIAVEAKHALYSSYHERILKAVDTCVPITRVLSIDEMAAQLTGTQRNVLQARELGQKVKRALRDQVGECLTCSIGIAPNLFLGKVASDLQKPDGLVVIARADLPGALLGLDLQDICGIGARMEERLRRVGITTVAELWNASSFRLRRAWGGVNGAVLRDAARRRFSAAPALARKDHGAPACP
jgi:DNA polymerase-4